MKIRLSGGAFLAAVIVACCAWLVFYAHGALAREANKRLQGQVEKGFFSGAALASRNGKVIFARAYGMADAEQKIPNTLDTRFRIASITKTFTAILVMQLEGEHRLALTDPICKYLDECPAGWQPITLHHLLSHTSGVHNFQRRRPGETETVEEMFARHPGKGEAFARFLHEPLDFAPGERFEYTGSNYQLLTHVIERVTGMAYEDVLRARILDPAGMHDTGFTHDWPSTPHAAVGYWLSRQGKTERAPVVDGGWSSGDGGLYSTVFDLQKFSDALDSDKLIPRATLERMRTPMKETYGYGWETPPVSKITLNRRETSHGGAIPGFLSRFQRFEAEKVTVIVLSNKQAGTLAQVTQALGSAVFDEPFTPAYERETVEVPEEVLQRYAGEYEFGGSLFVLFVRDGHLYARSKEQANPGPDMPLLAESETVFFMKGMDGDITIAHDGIGNPTGLAVNLGDGSRFAKKVR